MADEISLDISRLAQEELTAEQLIDKLESMLPQMKILSFGANGARRTSGPCADAMEELTTEMEAVIVQMVATMRELLAFIRGGALNIEDMDAFLAKQMAGVGSAAGGR